MPLLSTSLVRCFAVSARRAAPVLAAAALLALSPAARADARLRPVAVRLTPLSSLAVAHQANASGSAPAASSQPLSPGQIRRAYSLPSAGVRGQTIAFITAFDNPDAQNDLNAYTAEYGLPRCTGANRCFVKLNQEGKTSPLPGPDATGGVWRSESAIGIETARGICGSCRIMLVEATSTAREDFAAAVKAAAKAGATVIITTFTQTEDVYFDRLEAPSYSNPHAIVVSAVGDADQKYGYTGEANFPSSLPGVLAVGGTNLRTRGNGAYVAEQAWNGTVSGCSLYQQASSWQTVDAAALGCQKRRAVADVAAMSDPGATVHISHSGQPGGPWFAATGTSLSAPIIAGVIGLAGSAGSREPQMLYERERSDPGAFHDITSGVNKAGCTTRVCEAMRGFDGPTGLGTPFGLAAFLPSGGELDKSRPNVAASAPRNRLKADRHWKVHPTLTNGNPFAIAGQLLIQGTVKIHGHRKTVKFASSKVQLDPLSHSVPAIALGSAQRALLKRLGHALVTVRLLVHGPAGRTVTVTNKLALYAP